jgi:hypothetical protein
MNLLQDPIDTITSFQIKLELAQLCEQLSGATFVSSTTVTPNVSDACFEITLVLKSVLTGDLITGFITLKNS